MNFNLKLKKIRTFRKITQKELSEKIGLTDQHRIVQYEKGVRVPKKDLVDKMAKALDVNPYTLYDTAGRDASEMMELLFWLDEFNPSALHLLLPRKFPGEKCNEVADTSVYYHDNDSWPAHAPVCMWFDYGVLNDFLKEWVVRMDELKSGAQNDLYSMGSRLSQKSRLFNRLVWEPMNYEGFRKLTYNAADQKNAELMAPVYANIPKDIPVVATHVWPAQAALHAGMKYVVNAIPDNWQMALHLAEGSIHTVQTHYAYQGYRILNGMQGNDVLNPMPEDALFYTGHYIDHELVSNIETDCAARKQRKEEGKTMRFLLTIGGAGAQKEIFAEIIRFLLPQIKEKKAALYVNVGDYRNVWKELLKEIPEMGHYAKEHFNDWEDTKKFAEDALNKDVIGIHGFWHENIFEAVYCTNLLMRSCDVLVTKPSELSFYPVPKLFIRRVGGHEQWGAIHSAEIGDGTLECRDIPHTLQMMKLFLEEKTLLCDMCDNIVKNKEAGIYDGAYKVVELAFSMKQKKF